MAEARHHLYDSNMTNSARGRGRNRIHTYSLFGESAHLPDVLHCETIEARSVLHEWEFEPHRHARLHQLLLVESGAGMARLETGDHTLRPMSMVNVPPGEVHGFSFEPGTQGYVATLAEEMRDEILVQAPDVRRALLQARVLPADPAVLAALRQIWAEFNGRLPGRALLLRGLCASLLARVAREAAAQSAPRDGPSAQSELLRRFETALEAHYLEHWKVADYARALAVTPTHLSRIARAATGEPASRLIDARVMREARRNLAYTNLSVTTIAYALGFSDPAYFSRVFTRALGLSPRAFRARTAN
jgi:AraC family transcriptional regulator, transcriptional activator of pobA